MFCPQCKAEYRQGFTRCHDCDVDLVHELPPSTSSPAQQPELGGVRILDRFTNQESILSACYKLRDEGIPYSTTDAPGGIGFNMRIGRRYELFVSAPDYDRAKATLDLENDASPAFSEEDWRQLEEPEADHDPDVSQSVPVDDEITEPASEESLPDRDSRRDSYFARWYPEDATIEIWSQTGEVDFSGAIEMALKESLIRCRLETEDAIPKVFVVPEHEIQARQIVREIVEGQ